MRMKTKYNTVTKCLPVTFSFTLAGGGDECINWVLTRVRGVFLSILAHMNNVWKPLLQQQPVKKD